MNLDKMNITLNRKFSCYTESDRYVETFVGLMRPREYKITLTVDGIKWTYHVCGLYLPRAVSDTEQEHGQR